MKPAGDGWCARLFQYLPDGPIPSTFRAHSMGAWEHERLIADPHAFPSDGKHAGVHMCRGAHVQIQKHWMGLSASGPAPPTMRDQCRAFIPVAQHKLLMRFCSCCWPITAKRAWERPRVERTCPLCTADDVEDEHHVLMQCAAYMPSYG